MGMYSLAALTRNMGFSVSGSDRERNPLTDALLGEEIEISIGHSKDALVSADALVYTLALSEDNVELAYAKEQGIPIYSRAEYLGALMQDYDHPIGVSGTHGKSTVTAMLDRIFVTAGRNPTTVLGARLPDTASPLRLGDRSYFIYEACEYKDAFLCFLPETSVFTNLEYDHVDYFNDIDSLKASFLKAMNKPSLSVVNIEDENLRSLLPSVKTRTVTYGFSEKADYRAENITEREGYYSFSVYHKKERKFDVSLSVLGSFNILNALGAISTACEYGIDSSVIVRAISSFSGVERRIERIGEYNGLPIYYDYAHHPTEISCTVKALREATQGRVTVIFKPHTYSRTEGLFDGFVTSLSLADRVILLDISAIRERNESGITSLSLAEKIGGKAVYTDEEAVIEKIKDITDGVIVIMGAANMDKIRKILLSE